MRLHFLLAIVAAGLIGLSCAKDNPGNGGASLAGPLTPNAAPAGGGTRLTPDVQFPAGAQWTILCQEFKGVDHFSHAKVMKDQLMAVGEKTGLRNWWIFPTETGSSLHYGFYSEVDSKANKAEADRARADKAKVGQLSTEAGPIFPACSLVRLQQGDPDAPPEWKLTNAKGYWTLEVAVFKNIPDRKKEAVEAVREARKMGIEAYYHHGEVMSMVCIGAWPAAAVAQQEMDTAQGRSADEFIMLFSGPVDNIPKGLTTPDGKPIRVLAPKFEILDPTMKRAKDQYPNHAIDGVCGVTAKNPQTGQWEEKLSTSYFVVIPDRKPELGRPQPPERGPDMVAPNPLDPTRGGNLR